MNPKHRDVMLAAGVLSLVIAGFLAHPIAGFAIIGFVLIATVYLLTPDPEPEPPADDVEEGDG